jgi:hypothetical protein
MDYPAEAGTVRKTKIMAIAVLAAVLAGCSGGSAHQSSTHASAAATSGSGAVPVPGGPAVTAACARFRSATIVMLEQGPTQTSALRRYGLSMRHLGGPLAGSDSAPQRMLGDALVLVGKHALATAARQAPKGLIAAFNKVKRDAARAGAACPSAEG